jgi:hypothetical protein
MLRESDLEGHIEKEGAEQETEEKTEETDEPSPDEKTKAQKRIDSDNQLRSALQILQSWNLFAKIYGLEAK